MSFKYVPPVSTYSYNSAALICPDDPTLILDIKCICGNNVLTWNKRDSDYIILELDLSTITKCNDEKIVKDYLLNSLYINGALIKDLKTEKKYALIKKQNTDYPIVFNLYVNEASDFYEFCFDIKIYSGNYVNNEIISDNADVFVMNIWHASRAVNIDLYKKHATHIAEDNKTCMLMRTNPLLTGNIKVVVEDDKIYFDTFENVSKLTDKVSTSIKNEAISLNSDYGVNLYNTFKNISGSDLFLMLNKYYEKDLYLNIAINTLNSSIFKELYIDAYDYGATENKSGLKYKSKLKIFAPLFLQHVVPDYFIIFRKPITSELSDDIINENTDVVKIIDLRNHTNTGKYLRSWTIKCTKYAHRDIKYNESGDNYAGIRYKENFNGIVSSDLTVSNALYRRNMLTNGFNHEQIAYRAFLIYENEQLIHPNIINLEFMFTDDTALDFKLYNYYGLYMFENDIYNIKSIKKNNNQLSQFINTGNKLVLNNDTINKLPIIELIKILSPYKFIDDNDQEIDVNTLNDIVTNENLQDRVFLLTNKQNTRIVKTYADILKYLNECIDDNPGDLIGSTPVKLKEEYKKTESFITMLFSHEIHDGEHFRIIKPNSTTDGIDGSCTVYEIIASSDSRLLRYNTPIGHYVQTNRIDDIDIYSIPVYVFDKEDNTKFASIDEQIYRFNKALNKLGGIATLTHIAKDTIAIYSEEPILYFQHISEPNITDTIDYIHYYNTQHQTNLYDYNVYRTDRAFAYNNPITEINAVRLSSIVKFIKTSIFNDQYIYEINNSYDYELSGMTIPKYKGADGKFHSLNAFDISEHIKVKDSSIIQSKVYCIISPFNTNNRLISVDKNNATAIVTKNEINLYYSPTFSLAVAGLTNVKDIISKLSKVETKISNQALSYIRGASSNSLSFTNRNTLETIREMMNTLYPIKYSVSYKDTITIPADTPLNLKKIKELNLFTLYQIKTEDVSFKGVPELKFGTYICFINEDYLIYKCLKIEGSSEEPEFKILKYHTDNNRGYTILPNKDVELGQVNEESVFQFMDSKNNVISYADSTLNWTISNNTKQLLEPLVPNLSVQYNKTYVNGIFSKSSKDMLKAYTTPEYNVYNDDIQKATNRGYVKYSLNNRIIINNESMSVRDYILSGAENAMTLLYKKYLDTSMVYQTGQIAEFIYNDIKFNLKFNTANVYADIDANTWDLDGYEAILIFDYDNTRDTEIFVSHDEQLILIFEHKTNPYNSKHRSRHIKLLSNNSMRSANYYWYNAPFKYEFINSVSINKDTILLHKDYINDIYNDDLSKVNLFVLTGLPIYNHIADFSETGYMCTISYHNNINGNYDKIKHSDIYLSENITNDNSLMPISNKTINDTFYHYFLFASRYNEKHPEYINKMNDEDGLSYDMVDKTDKREYHPYMLMNVDKSENYTDIKDILRVLNNGNYILHYIQNNNATTVYINDVYNAISVNVESVESTYNNTYYSLHKEPVFEFEKEDKELSELTQMDFTFANTKIIKNEPLIQRTINKINHSTISEIEHSIFATPWVTDKTPAYFAGESNTPYQFKKQGYWPKLFFGSCCMLVKPKINVMVLLNSAASIEVKNASYDYMIAVPSLDKSIIRNTLLTQISKASLTSNIIQPKFLNTTNIPFTINRNHDTLTIYPINAFKSVMLEDETFKSNWDDIINVQTTALNNYIDQTLKSFYDIKITFFNNKGEAIYLDTVNVYDKWARMVYKNLTNFTLSQLLIEFTAYNQ